MIQQSKYFLITLIGSTLNSSKNRTFIAYTKPISNLTAHWLGLIKNVGIKKTCMRVGGNFYIVTPTLGVVCDYVVNINDKKVNLQSVLQS